LLTIDARRKRGWSVVRIISSRFRQRDSLLFVYGTLRPSVDIPMARWLHRVAHRVGAAKTRGRLYDLGAYPGFRPARCSDEWVTGDLYRVPTPTIFRVLDCYEAGTRNGRPRFVRQRRSVVTARGSSCCAWLYVYRLAPLRRVRIRHGDYLLHGAARAQT